MHADGSTAQGVLHNEQDDEMLCPALRPVRDATEMTITTRPDITTGPDVIMTRPEREIVRDKRKHYLLK